MNGALLISKHSGVSSFGVIEALQRDLKKRTGISKRHDLPKMGHGGTLDPFATGLLVVLIGRGVKLAQYFLGSIKAYEGVMKFGETTLPGDLTDPISERTSSLPQTLEEIQQAAHSFTLKPYPQIPPMHSAKKLEGKPLYELARAGIEVERKPKLCKIYQFEISSYEEAHAHYQVQCSAGTYIRTLAQDLAKNLNSLAYLKTLHRTRSGGFSVQQAWSMDQITRTEKPWDQLPCWIPFDQLLDHFPRVLATEHEAQCLIHGKQHVLETLIQRAGDLQAIPYLAIYREGSLVAIARKEEPSWRIDRVFTTD